MHKLSESLVQCPGVWVHLNDFGPIEKINICLHYIKKKQKKTIFQNWFFSCRTEFAQRQQNFSIRKISLNADC